MLKEEKKEMMIEKLFLMPSDSSNRNSELSENTFLAELMKSKKLNEQVFK